MRELQHLERMEPHRFSIQPLVMRIRCQLYIHCLADKSETPMCQPGPKFLLFQKMINLQYAGWRVAIEWIAR